MDNIPRLYDTCLRKISLLLKEGTWNSSDVNPFSKLPKKIIDNLTSTALQIQQLDGFSAEDLKLLLTSGKLSEFKIEKNISRCNRFCKQVRSTRHNPYGYRKLELEIARALNFLASACQNLEVLQLTFGGEENQSRVLSNALQDLLKNSPKLKYIHCKVAFKLKVLRTCKQLKSILLHFVPNEPWYDFLEIEKPLEEGFQNSLETFTICEEIDVKIFKEVFSEYIMVILMYCPSLTSLGSLDTSRALARFHERGLKLPLKLRRCYWRRGEYIRDAVTYYPVVEELSLSTNYIRSIEPLRNLRNLVILSLFLTIERDISELLDSVLKDIGIQLKGLSLWFRDSTLDISMLLTNCPNLEALKFALECTRCSVPAINLPHLKHLSIKAAETSRRVFFLFEGCHNLTKLFISSDGLDDEVLDEFLRKNSFENLKIAYFENSNLTKGGFKKFLKSVPNLEKVNAKNYLVGRLNENDVKDALIKTNHKAVNDRYYYTSIFDVFTENSECNGL